MKKRILVVEDSILMQRVISDIVASCEDFTVCGFARNVTDAWAKFYQTRPDLVTLDYELPGENGLVLLKKIMDSHPTPVLMLSAHTKAGAELTIRALQLGAVDFFTKPSGPISIDLYNLKDELIAKLKVVAEANLACPPKIKTGYEFKGGRDLYIGIGSSTGGVQALNYLVPLLPAKCGLRVLIVQHMPRYFTASLSQHLNEHSGLVVKEAQDSDLILKNEVLIAPGGYHIKILKSGKRVMLSTEPPKHEVRPSVDVLFESMSEVYKTRAMGIILTGMGHDGAQGIRLIKEQGGITIAQDPKEALISRMPQSAIDTGAVDFVLSLDKIPKKISEIMGVLND